MKNRIFSGEELEKLASVAPFLEATFYFVIFLFFREQFIFLNSHEFFYRGAASSWTHAWIPEFFNFRSVAIAISYLQLFLMPVLIIGISRPLFRWAIFALIFFNVSTRVNYFDAHNYHLYFYISFIFLFFVNKPLASAYRLRFCQIQILLVYGISGVWKLLAFPKSFFLENTVSPFNFLRYSIAHEYVSSNTLTAVGQWIVGHPEVGGASQLLTIALEVGCFFVIFRPRYYLAWGIMLVTFHSLTYVTMGLFFQNTQLLVFCFLVLPAMMGAMFGVGKTPDPS